MKLRTPHDALGRLLEVGDSVEMLDGEICPIFAIDGDHIYFYGVTGPLWTYARCVVWFSGPPAATCSASAVVAQVKQGQGVRAPSLPRCTQRTSDLAASHPFPARPFFVCTGCACDSWIDGVCGGLSSRSGADVASPAPRAGSAGLNREAAPMVITGITSNSSQVVA